MAAPASSIFQFRQGDHLCVFHRSEDSLMEVLSPYIAEGLRKDERCFCVQRPEIVRRLEYDLRFIGIDVEKALQAGSLEFRSIEEAYLPDGKFEPRVMMDMLLESIEASLRKGFSGFRSAGDLCWAAADRGRCSQLLGYEAMVEECFPGRRATGMCQYAIDSFPPEILRGVMNLHRQRVVEPTAPCAHASLCVTSDHCNTEIVAEKFLFAPKYYYVVEQQPQGDIVGWGTAPDFDRAAENADLLVRQLRRPLPN
jgi:MEDS: MEthanogen/methylotroph, DcmR Sensory domain